MVDSNEFIQSTVYDLYAVQRIELDTIKISHLSNLYESKIVIIWAEDYSLSFGGILFEENSNLYMS